MHKEVAGCSWLLLHLSVVCVLWGVVVLLVCFRSSKKKVVRPP